MNEWRITVLRIPVYVCSVRGWRKTTSDRVHRGRKDNNLIEVTAYIHKGSITRLDEVHSHFFTLATSL